MYSCHNRDDLEKLKTLQGTKCLLKVGRLKKQLGNKIFIMITKKFLNFVTTNEHHNQDIFL